jgi:hypothetical protein
MEFFAPSIRIRQVYAHRNGEDYRFSVKNRASKERDYHIPYAASFEATSSSPPQGRQAQQRSPDHLSSSNATGNESQMVKQHSSMEQETPKCCEIGNTLESKVLHDRAIKDTILRYLDSRYVCLDLPRKKKATRYVTTAAKKKALLIDQCVDQTRAESTSF